MSILPFETPLGFENALHPKDDKKSLWFIFSADQLLVSDDRKRLPDHSHFELKRSLYLGTFNNKHLYAGEVISQEPALKGWAWHHLRTLYTIIDEPYYAIAGRAMQLINWDRTHMYCGCCGNETFPRKQERCRKCSACGHLAYPTLTPAILALVKRDKQILLARGPHFPENWYSVLAGFVDPGETLEHCVAREVFEEVGIKVKNISYFGSQPWPFSRSLMIAFICDWESGEIDSDPAEISDANWFDLAHLPELPPSFSLARILIDSFVND